jgi:hypothetical protein
MKHLIILTALALAACGPGPRSGETVNIGPGPHMTSSHPAFAACGRPADYVDPGVFVCR